MLFQFLVASAVVPSLLLIWFFHSRDVYPEPQRVVWATFGLGVLTTIPAIALELPIGAALAHVQNPLLGGTLDGFFCAAMVEEGLKYAVVVFYCMRHVEFDEPMDGIVYGAVASLGFATLENVLYVAQGGVGQAILRAASAVPGHACMGAIMGYFVGQAKFAPKEKKGGLMAAAYFVPFMLHGLYDAPLLALARVSKDKTRPQEEMLPLLVFALLTLAVLVFEIAWTLVLTHRLRRQQQGWKARGWVPPTPVAPPAKPGGALAVLMVVFGALFACGGGLMSLGALIALLGGHDKSQLGALVAAGVLFGLLPLALGALLFGLGLRSLTRVMPVVPVGR